MPNTDTRFLWNDAVKRVLDITLSFMGLLALAPLFALVAIVIRRDSPGPIFYRGRRLGRGDRPFFILKFRTMREEAASYTGPRLTAQDDKRITPLGKWLRDTKINELPQLWNVIKGEMSLVGPRPEDPELAESWPLDVRVEILSVRPGVTSPASVLYRDEEDLLSSQTLMKTYLGEIMPSKLRLDQLYVRHRSLLVDLDVLFWTFLVLLPRLKHLKPLEEYLFWGPLSRLMRRYINWFILDMLTTLIALTLTGVLWRIFGPLNVGFLQALLFVVIYSVIFSLSGAFSGIQRIAWRYAALEDVLDLVPPTLLAGFVTLMINYFTRVFPPDMLLTASGLTFTGYILTRYRQRLFSGFVARWFALRGVAGKLGERVLIVGSGEAGQFAAWSLMNMGDASAFRVVGFVDDDMFKQQVRLRGVHVIGKRNQIPELVQRYDVGVIIYAIHNISEPECQEILRICRHTHARTVIWPDVLSFVRSAVIPSESQGKLAAVASYTGRYIRREQVTSWLDGIEHQLENGTLHSLEEQIHSIRMELRQKL
jgi:lipopolysaccharide/colanic/teichoic acid biosynthesis glycosyltransferase